MDKFDRAIIGLLSENARRPLSHIGREIGLSRTSVAERVQRLEQNNVIAGYTIKIGSGPKVNEVKAYFQMTFSPFKLAQLLEGPIKSIPEIKSCHSLSGDIDLIMYVEAQSMDRLNLIRGQLEQLPNLQRLLTCPVLQEVN